MTRCPCAVAGCCNTSYYNREIQFFRFPKSTQRFEKWLKLIGRPDLAGRSSRNYYICEQHFSRRAFTLARDKRTLDRNAVPTRRLPGMLATDGPADSDDSEDSQTDKGTHCEFGEGSNTTQNKQLVSKCVHNRANFDLLCNKLFPKNVAKLVKKQADIKSHLKKEKCSADYKQFCLHFYHTSPAAYMALQRALNLPPVRTLQTICNSAMTGGLSFVVNTLIPKIDNMSDLEKNCAVLVSKVKLKPQLYYHISEDKIYGFCERDGEQKPEVAKYAIIIVLRGLYNSWTLPIDCALIPTSNDDAISDWIDWVLSELINIGLKVRICITNMRSSLVTGTKVTVEEPFFCVHDYQIYLAYDPSYLIQNVYWYLMNHEFHFEGLVAKWQDIIEFYVNDSRKIHRLVPELSERHVKPNDKYKLEDRLAKEVLSERVAAGISNYIDFKQMDSSAMGTVKLLTMVSRIYKFMSSSKAPTSCKYQKPYTGSHFQVNFAKEALTFIRELKLVKDGVDVTHKVDIKFLKQFQITINAVMHLFEELADEKVPNLYTGHIGLDSVNSILKQIREKNRTTDITPWGLMSARRRILIKNMLKLPKQRSCPSWISDILQEHLYNTLKPEDVTINGTFKAANLNLPVRMIDYKHLKLPAKNQLFAICSFLLSKCKEKHSKCSLPIKQSGEYPNIRKIFFEEVGNEIISPMPINFLDFIMALDDKLEASFDMYFEHRHLLLWTNNSSVDLLSQFDPPCKCFPVVYMVKLYYRFRIAQQLRANNRRFQMSSSTEPYLFRFENLQ